MSAADQILRNGDERGPSPAEGLDFGGYYYAYDCGEPYERSERWLGFFDKIAARIVSDLGPGSVLDAGCALGDAGRGAAQGWGRGLRR